MQRGKYFFQQINFNSFLFCRKLVIKDQQYNKELGATTACIICTGEAATQVKEARTF